jgi:hypothetical protein
VSRAIVVRGVVVAFQHLWKAFVPHFDRPRPRRMPRRCVFHSRQHLCLDACKFIK